jgi:hypothetical protein
VIVISHEWYRLMCERDVPHVPAAFVVSAMVTLAGLYLLRREFLGGIGGYGFMVTRGQMLTNLLKGPAQTLFLRPIGSVGTWIQAWGMTIALLAGGILGWRRRERRHLFLLGVGILIVFCFDLPFALVTKREQYYALTLGSVFAFAACTDILTRWARPAIRAAAIVPVVIVLATMSARSAAARDLYAPFSESTLSTDRLVAGWAPVPFEIREWLRRKIAHQRVTALSRDVPYIVFGANDVERDPRGNLFRWTGRRAWIYANGTTDGLRFVLSAAGGERPRRPFVMTISGGRPSASTVRLEPGQQQAIDVAFPKAIRPVAAMRPVRIDVDHTWTPGPRDPRQLGVMLSGISIAGESLHTTQ